MKQKNSGRGAKINPHNRFSPLRYEAEAEYLEYCRLQEELPESNRTRFIEIHPKTIINKVNSPDLGFTRSINPYQGCEHGCTYCYARNSHEYWGYSSGTDFERTILVKKSAPELLRKELSKPGWKPEAIVLSGNTDCYQPAEHQFQITRKLLEIMLETRHPVGIITKNSLILRDMDILSELAKLNLLRVNVSVTTLNESLRRRLEPRTASIAKRLQTIQSLSDIGVPVHVNFAPIIPGLTSHELFELAKKAAESGATTAGYIMLRLNGKLGEIFESWVREDYPDRADKVLNLIRETHGGKLNDSRWNTRMKGEGPFAEQIARSFKLACLRYGLNKDKPKPLATELFRAPARRGQLDLFYEEF